MSAVIDPFAFSARRSWAPSTIPTYPQHEIDMFVAHYGKPMDIVYHYQGSLADFDPSRSPHPFATANALLCRVQEYNGTLASRGQPPMDTIHYLQYKCPTRYDSVVTIFEMTNGVNVKWMRQEGHSHKSPKYLFAIYDPVRDRWSTTKKI